jgi:hypothetical protein
LPVSIFTTHTPAGALPQPLDERDAAEYSALTDLGEADESQGSDEVDASGETGYLCDRPPRTALQVDLSQAPFAGFKQPEFSLIPARRVRHGKATEQDFVFLYVHQDAAPGLVRSPTTRRVSFAQRGDVLGAAVDHGDAIQVTAVLRC